MIRLHILGKIQLISHQVPKFAEISRKFLDSWIKGGHPTICAIFSISNDYLQRRWDEYKRTLGHLGHPQRTEEHYHGTVLACAITSTQVLCRYRNCGICGIACAGMDPNCIRKNIDFQRFGSGFYLAPNSSKCNDYTEKNSSGYKAMLLCDILPGRKYNLETNHQNLTGPPSGYDSVNGIVGCKLNYPEIVIYNPNAIMPKYIIVYQ